MRSAISPPEQRDLALTYAAVKPMDGPAELIMAQIEYFIPLLLISFRVPARLILDKGFSPVGP